MPTEKTTFSDADDDQNGQNITFLTQGNWTTHDLELLAVSVSQIYDSRLATLLWTRQFLAYIENRNVLLKSAFLQIEKRMPGPFFHEWYEVWMDLLSKGEFSVLPIPAPFPMLIESGFPTPRQIYESLDLYASEKERCVIQRAKMSSAGGFSFTGVGKIVKEIREFVKDLWYRNSQEKQKGDIELQKDKLDLIEKYLALRDRLSSSHQLIITVSGGVDGLLELERGEKLRPVDEHIDHTGEL